MGQERNKRLESLFHAGIEMSTEERERYWKVECGLDQGMLGELEELLRGHERAEMAGFLEKPIWAPPGGDRNGGDPEMIGKKIGDYEILRLIGQGGMGDVYLAKKPPLTREVVIKVVKDSVDPIFRRQFIEEMRVHERLKHENIVMLHDAGIEQEAPYLVLEYFPSVSLRDYLHDPANPQVQRQLPVEDLLEITGQIAAGLGYAHRQNITHRDIKPENILISKTEPLKVKVIDFGIAILPEMAMTHSSGATTRRMTVGASGTPVYMSPEQLKNGIELKMVHRIDTRTDIYAFGLVVYEMLTGQLAFPSEEARHLGKFKLPGEIREGLPSGVDDVMKRVMSEEPKERYQTVDDFFAALATALGRTGSDGVPPPTRRGKLKPVVGLAGLLGAAGLAAALWMGGSRLPWRVAQSGAVSATPTPTAMATPQTSVPPPVNKLLVSLLAKAVNERPEPVAPETVFRDRSRVRIRIDLEQRGYLYLIEERDNGEVGILYPETTERGAEVGAVSAGEAVTLPKRDWFEFGGKPGTDSVYILFARERGEQAFEPVESAMKAGRRKIDVAGGQRLMAALRAGTATGVADRRGDQLILSGEGTLVGVLKLRHE